MKSDRFSASQDRSSQDRHSRMIDNTLRTIGNATPLEGIEGRVAIHLAHARESNARTAHKSFSLSRLLVAASSCGVACAAIIAGSVHHSRAALPAAPSGDIRLAAPSGGLGAASAAHLATKPVAPTGRPRAVRKSTDGRATVEPDAQKRAVETVPQRP